MRPVIVRLPGRPQPVAVALGWGQVDGKNRRYSRWRRRSLPTKHAMPVEVTSKNVVRRVPPRTLLTMGLRPAASQMAIYVVEGQRSTRRPCDAERR